MTKTLVATAAEPPEPWTDRQIARMMTDLRADAVKHGESLDELVHIIASEVGRSESEIARLSQ